MKTTKDLTSDNLDTEENRACRILAVGDTVMVGLSFARGHGFENVFSDDILSSP